MNCEPSLVPMFGSTPLLEKKRSAAIAPSCSLWQYASHRCPTSTLAVDVRVGVLGLFRVSPVIVCGSVTFKFHLRPRAVGETRLSDLSSGRIEK